MAVIETRIRGSWVPVTCSHCKQELEYDSASTTATTTKEEELTLKCAKCGQTWTTSPSKAKESSSSTKKDKKRRIGTDERPLETDYYDILGLPITCTTEDVKKAYRRLAIKYHPDKNPNDPNAGERFKEIALAYTTLSDPQSRHSYNEFGKAKGDAGADPSMIDPEAIFSQLFGGERFQDIIGTISLGQEMKTAMQEEDDQEDDNAKKDPAVLTFAEKEALEKKKKAKEAADKKAAEEKAKLREERVKALCDKLRDKLALYTEQAQGEEDQQIAKGVRTMWTIEADELKNESYGVELLQTVGFVYASKSKHYLASTGPIPFGLGGWIHSAKSTAHIVSETVSTVRSAYALKDVFETLAQAEKSGLSDEKKKELEDKAAQMGLHALFKGAKLEVESIIREVCDRILSEKTSTANLRKRAVALGILGEVYEAIKRDSNAPDPLLGATMPGATQAKPAQQKS